MLNCPDCTSVLERMGTGKYLLCPHCTKTRDVTTQFSKDFVKGYWYNNDRIIDAPAIDTVDESDLIESLEELVEYHNIRDRMKKEFEGYCSMQTPEEKIGVDRARELISKVKGEMRK